MQFQYGEVQNYYYYGRHAVDDNNNNRQGCLGFEDVFQPKGWEMRQLGFIIALSQTNAFLAWNYYKMKDGDKELSKADFVRDLAQEMIENDIWKREKRQDKNKAEKLRESKRKRVEHHELLRIPTGVRKWDGTHFRKVAQEYQKYSCSTRGCKALIRTYCSCDKSFIL